MTGRLIDADKLKNIIEVSTRFSDFLGKVLNDDKTAEIYRSTTEGFIKQIDAEPTVEAIPVEWLKSHMITHGEVANGDYFEDEALELNMYVSDLIGRWREEQRKEE